VLGCWLCYHADDQTTRTVGTGAALGSLDRIVTHKSRGRAGEAAWVCGSAALGIIVTHEARMEAGEASRYFHNRSM
jgi:hypothetical protein